jgi:hypothetical protein
MRWHVIAVPYDFSSRVSGGYMHGLGSGGPAPAAPARGVSTFYAELADRQLGLAGLTPSHAGDVLGIFMALVSWR